MVAKLPPPKVSASSLSHDPSAPPASISRCSPWLTPLVYFLGQRLVMPGYFGSITASGLDNVPTEGPVILAPTHRARWDSIILPMLVGRPLTGRDLRYMVTADEVTGIQGWLIRRLGGFPVNVREPSIASLRHGIDLLEQESMLVIFPEGGIFKDGQVHRLKPGLARLAVQAESIHQSLGVKVLPISLRYSDRAVGWRSSVDVVIGQPLEVASYLTPGHGSDRLKASAKHLTADLTAALTQLSDQ